MFARPLRTAAALCLLLLAGCGSSDDGFSAHPEFCTPIDSASAPVSAGPDAPRIVSERKADLLLWISNQSFADNRVTLTISVDGNELVSEPYDVGNQHMNVKCPIKAPPGKHILTVVSDTGASLEKVFTLPQTGRRYAAIDYWSHPARYSWNYGAEPISFA